MANLVYTCDGPIERERLELFEEFVDAPDHFVHVIGYRLDGREVKRGVSVHIKQGVEATLATGRLG